MHFEWPPSLHGDHDRSTGAARRRRGQPVDFIVAPGTVTAGGGPSRPQVTSVGRFFTGTAPTGRIYGARLRATSRHRGSREDHNRSRRLNPGFDPPSEPGSDDRAMGAMPKGTDRAGAGAGSITRCGRRRAPASTSRSTTRARTTNCSRTSPTSARRDLPCADHAPSIRGHPETSSSTSSRSRARSSGFTVPSGCAE